MRRFTDIDNFSTKAKLEFSEDKKIECSRHIDEYIKLHMKFTNFIAAMRCNGSEAILKNIKKIKNLDVALKLDTSSVPDDNPDQAVETYRLAVTGITDNLISSISESRSNIFSNILSAITQYKDNYTLFFESIRPMIADYKTKVEATLSSTMTIPYKLPVYKEFENTTQRFNERVGYLISFLDTSRISYDTQSNIVDNMPGKDTLRYRAITPLVILLPINQMKDVKFSMTGWAPGNFIAAFEKQIIPSLHVCNNLVTAFDRCDKLIAYRTDSLISAISTYIVMYNLQEFILDYIHTLEMFMSMFYNTVK